MDKILIGVGVLGLFSVVAKAIDFFMSKFRKPPSLPAPLSQLAIDATFSEENLREEPTSKIERILDDDYIFELKSKINHVERKLKKKLAEPKSKTLSKANDDDACISEFKSKIKRMEKRLAKKSAEIESIKEKSIEERRSMVETRENLDNEWRELRKEKERLEGIKSASRSKAASIVKKIQEKAYAKYELDCVKCYNLAITGQSGSGKSTLVNMICGFQDDDTRAATVDVKECTELIKKYVHPEMDHLIIWDFPGAGTIDHPTATYFDDKMLYAYDFLVILFTERFKEIEANLITKAIQHEIPVACVRNKANHDLTAEKKKKSFKHLPEDQLKAQLIETLRRDTCEKLAQCGVLEMPKIFIINSWAFGDEAEPLFEEVEFLEHVASVVEARRNK